MQHTHTLTITHIHCVRFVSAVIRSNSVMLHYQSNSENMHVYILPDWCSPCFDTMTFQITVKTTIPIEPAFPAETRHFTIQARSTLDVPIDTYQMLVGIIAQNTWNL